MKTDLPVVIGQGTKLAFCRMKPELGLLQSSFYPLHWIKKFRDSFFHKKNLLVKLISARLEARYQFACRVVMCRTPHPIIIRHGV
jgi:hypothetical protein